MSDIMICLSNIVNKKKVEKDPIDIEK